MIKKVHLEAIKISYYLAFLYFFRHLIMFLSILSWIIYQKYESFIVTFETLKAGAFQTDYLLNRAAQENRILSILQVDYIITDYAFDSLHRFDSLMHLCLYPFVHISKIKFDTFYINKLDLFIKYLTNWAFIKIRNR